MVAHQVLCNDTLMLETPSPHFQEFRVEYLKVPSKKWPIRSIHDSIKLLSGSFVCFKRRWLQ